MRTDFVRVIKLEEVVTKEKIITELRLSLDAVMKLKLSNFIANVLDTKESSHRRRYNAIIISKLLFEDDRIGKVDDANLK